MTHSHDRPPTQVVDSDRPADFMDAELGRPLEGIRVIELGNYIAAPTAGRLLADFGAEVIKVERPRTGDELRNWRLYAGHTSLLYRTINRGKKSIALDLRTEAGRDTVLELVERSDVLLENFRPGTLDGWGLGAARLQAVNPELVVARVSAFGQTGPLSSRPGFAAVAEAYGGLRALVGEADRPPSRTGVSIGDSIAGLYAAFGVVMALFQRDSRRAAGEPRLGPCEQHVDVALHEAVFSMMESLIPDRSAYGVNRERVGGRMEGIAPTNAYACADGSSVVIAANGDSIFRRCMQVIGRTDLGENPGLQTNTERWKHRDLLDSAIGAWTESCTRAEALAELDRAGVPAGPILEAADIIDDPHYRARGMIQTLPVDTGSGIEAVDFPGIVPLLGCRSLQVRSVGPDLGEHTESVLRSVLGKTTAQIERVFEEGVHA
ncbi:CaiB/BaiF CoA-transferase family protein [Nocardioides sp. LS1]|uniref:CaiB/BaiF CoA transferase family protein n=1 Tax=Nocardioides sp. LS1 TaxID=1027620 RepID=UPI000FFA82FA|nr:CaiB/BaiF CoA-transferase family protein [Nocardioides sp. LS1]GCD91167.1 CoA transferase [Nocardioides sp. LS1]